MHWEDIVGHTNLKKQLQESIIGNRIAHAQLFYGLPGSGVLPLALAYAREVLCGQDRKAHAQFDSYQHPDLFFSYPIAINKEKKIEKSANIIGTWRSFLKENPYGDFSDWSTYLEAENKKLLIGVEDAQDIVRNFNLKSYQGGYKVQVIWLAEKMNAAAANKLLKLIEEPPEKSLLILIAENPYHLLPTIQSRCQTVAVPPLSFYEIENYVHTSYGVGLPTAKMVAIQSGGSLGKAISLSQKGNNQEFEKYFIHWIRNAFMAKKNPAVLQELSKWSSEIHGWGREKQIEFIQYCNQIFRTALLKNYRIDPLAYKPIYDNDFKWDSFCAYIHGGNIEDIMKSLDSAAYEISRNVNAKTVLFDLSMEVTRLIHQKQV